MKKKITICSSSYLAPKNSAWKFFIKKYKCKFLEYGDFQGVLKKKSFDDVYPIIRNLSKNIEKFYDLSGTLDKDYYLDWCCHLNSEGNRYVAEKIFEKIFLK